MDRLEEMETLAEVVARTGMDWADFSPACHYIQRDDEQARLESGLPALSPLLGMSPNPVQTLYVVLDVVPPRPVQFEWKNSPRGLSTLS